MGRRSCLRRHREYQPAPDRQHRAARPRPRRRTAGLSPRSSGISTAPQPRWATGALWGTTAAMRRLAELVFQAAVQAEEEAGWQAHQAAITVRRAEAGGMNALLDAALGYAARGIPVYPAHWPRPHPGWGQPGLLLSARPRL